MAIHQHDRFMATSPDIPSALELGEMHLVDRLAGGRRAVPLHEYGAVR